MTEATNEAADEATKETTNEPASEAANEAIKISAEAKRNKRPIALMFGEIKNNKRNQKSIVLAVLLILVSLLSYYLVSADEGFYNKPIARVSAVTETLDHQSRDMNGNVEQVNRQHVKAVIMNGSHKGEEIELTNQSSYSQAYDLKLKPKDEVFIAVSENSAHQINSARILDFKRDKYIAYIAILFILFIVLIGGKKGLRSLTSVLVNTIVFLSAIGLYLHGFNLTLVISVASVLFILVSIALVSGMNKKSLSAIIGTLAGTAFSMGITLVVIAATNANGIHYEEMEFLTCPPQQIFLMEILVGTLGGIMDIAISISSSVRELAEQTPGIDRKALLHSGMEIGKDIMGTMANTLVFAYMSGSIPMILLWLKNGFSLFYIINFNLCLEIIRALTGSIGIVLSIPITLYISVLLLKGKRNGSGVIV